MSVGACMRARLVKRAPACSAVVHERMRLPEVSAVAGAARSGAVRLPQPGGGGPRARALHARHRGALRRAQAPPPRLGSQAAAHCVAACPAAVCQQHSFAAVYRLAS